MRWMYLLVFMIVLNAGEAQESTWRILSGVEFEKEYNSDLGFEVEKPNFGPWIKALEGKEIEVQGYIIPLQGKKAQNYFMFSALPYELCFFCGKAGPETAMEVYMKEGQKLKYDPNKFWLKGILELNRYDATKPIYILREAEKINK